MPLGLEFDKEISQAVLVSHPSDADYDFMRPLREPNRCIRVIRKF